VSVPHDYTQDLAGIEAPILLIYGRYDRMVPFEISIAMLNHIADSRLVLLNNCGHWPPFEKPAEWTAQVLAFLRGKPQSVRSSRLESWAVSRASPSRLRRRLRADSGPRSSCNGSGTLPLLVAPLTRCL
jgi:hypothetical protein